MIGYVADEDGMSLGEAKDMRLLIEIGSGSVQLTTADDVREKSHWDNADADREYWRRLEVLYPSHGLFDANVFLDPMYDDEHYIWITARGTDGFSSVESGEVELKIPSVYLPEQNEALYTKFPGLKQYIGEGYAVQIHLKGWLSAEEILHLLMEDGQEISFEGVTVPEYYSADGQEHKIESFEDWDKWYTGERRE